MLATLVGMGMFRCLFQAEDGIRDAQESRGLGDVYKRQLLQCAMPEPAKATAERSAWHDNMRLVAMFIVVALSLIHI